MKQNSQEKPATGAGGSLAVAAGKLLHDHGNLVVPAVFVMGIAVVYMLGMRAGPREASADEQQNELRVESALDRLDRVETDDRDAKTVVQSFYTNTKRRQIPAGNLSRNVFTTEHAGLGEDPQSYSESDGGESSGGSSAQREALSRVKSLRLQSVLSGQSDSRALISDTLVSEGETIEGWTVSEIRRRSVILTWNDRSYVLQMPQ
ncbi:MAG: hypothetical protein ACLFVW_01030 [Phycisphaerae bacterium]